MKRQRRAVRVIACVEPGLFVEKTVVTMCGGDRPLVVLREVVHCLYEVVHRARWEYIEDFRKINGFEYVPPSHDKVTYDPSDFTHIYLKRTHGQKHKARALH